MTDIAELLAAQKETGSGSLDTEHDRLRKAILGAGDLVYDWNAQQDHVEWYGNLPHMFGDGVEDFLSDRAGFEEFLDDEAIAARNLAIDEATLTDGRFSIQYRVFQMTGEMEWVEERSSVTLGEDGKVIGIVGVLRIVSDWHERETVLVNRARFDDLTGLLSRGELISGMLKTLKEVNEQERPALYYLVGIDNLAIINGAYGFDVADEVIVSIGERLKTCMAPTDMIGRMGGNSYGIVKRESRKEDAAEFGEKLLKVVRGTVIETPAGPVSTTISVGCVPLAGQGYASNQVLAHAEDALAAAKEHGRDRYVIYQRSSKREENRRRNIAMTEQVVSALRQGRLFLAYQAIADSATNLPVYHECLLRMVLTDGEVIAAGRFIPAIESLGLVRLVDRRTLELAVETLEQYPEAKLTLNVSALTVTDTTWINDLVTKLKFAPDVAKRLVIEITETAAMHDERLAIKFVRTLRSLGCGIALDDFGAGHTSFRHLKSLELDTVKIDGAFIRDLLEHEDNQLFVKTLVNLAQNLNLTTVAEFVGSQEEIDLLRSYGVEYVQGYYIGIPELAPPWVLKEDVDLGLEASYSV